MLVISVYIRVNFNIQNQTDVKMNLKKDLTERDICTKIFFYG